jgi:hypothetical protein
MSVIKSSGYICWMGTIHRVNLLGTKSNIFYLKVPSVPRRKHPVSVIKTSQLTLYMEIIAVHCEIPEQHSNTLCGQKLEFLNVQPGGI